MTTRSRKPKIETWIEKTPRDGYRVRRNPVGQRSRSTTIGAGRTLAAARAVKSAILLAEERHGVGRAADDAARKAIEFAGVEGWVG